MTEGICDPGEPRIVSGCAPFFDLVAQIRQDGCVRRVGGKIDHFVRIDGEIVEFFGRTMGKGVQRPLAELGPRRARAGKARPFIIGF
jgi:hypothetical protein